jgi:hypothetical protein
MRERGASDQDGDLLQLGRLDPEGGAFEVAFRATSSRWMSWRSSSVTRRC